MSPTVFEPTFTAVPAQQEDAATTRTRAIWTSGDFAKIAVGYATSAAEFVARLELAQGEQVLDVACGNGNLTLPAARAGALATGIDIAPNLIELATVAAAEEGLAVRFEVGDAEALALPSGSVETVISMFGVMFAPHAERAAAELLRVTRPAGRIVIANWTPSGFIGEMLRTVGAHVPAAPGAPSPLQWGVEEVVRERLAGVQHIEFVRRRATFIYPVSPAGTVQLFRDFYGPTVRAFAALDPSAQAKLENDLVALWSSNNRATDGTTRVESEYLETTALR